MQETAFADIDFSHFFFFFKVNHVCIEEDNPLKEVVIYEEKLDNNDIDGI